MLNETIKIQLIKFIRNPKEPWVLVEILYMVTFLLLWANNILPLMKITDVEQNIALIIVGFVFSSFLCAIYLLPKWMTMLTVFLFRNIKKLVVRDGSESR